MFLMRHRRGGGLMISLRADFLFLLCVKNKERWRKSGCKRSDSFLRRGVEALHGLRFLG
jgi:hypothetical protein